MIRVKAKGLGRQFLMAFAVLATITCIATVPSFAQNPTAIPAGSVLLTVTGLTPGKVLEFDREALDALPQQTLTTDTPWSDMVRRFAGPLGRDVLGDLAQGGTTLIATALNDYQVEIPVSDLFEFDVIFATSIDGQRLSVRDRGPIFVIYPFDQDRVLQSETYYSRAIWQLSSIRVE